MLFVKNLFILLIGSLCFSVNVMAALPDIDTPLVNTKTIYSVDFKSSEYKNKFELYEFSKNGTFLSFEFLNKGPTMFYSGGVSSSNTHVFSKNSSVKIGVSHEKDGSIKVFFDCKCVIGWQDDKEHAVSLPMVTDIHEEKIVPSLDSAYFLTIPIDKDNEIGFSIKKIGSEVIQN